MIKIAESIAQSTHGRVMQSLRPVAECLGSAERDRVVYFSCASSSEGSEPYFRVRKLLGYILSKCNLLKMVMSAAWTSIVRQSAR